MCEMEIADNVNRFLDWCSTEIGKAEGESFNIGTWSEYEDLGIESPIEQILYTAIKAVRKLNLIDLDDPVEICGEMGVAGLGLNPQKQIGKYHVDFLVWYGTYSSRSSRIKAPKKVQGSNNEMIISEVVVECDSQEFHERSEKERRYEKARDRFLQSNGYAVFRYTGSEIVKRPMEIAAEIISFVTGIDIENLQLDSNIQD
jgi:very-short-patch-repair endonuclease